MASSNKFIMCSIDHIEWNDYSKIIKNRSKGDQEVKNEENTWHIYYNHFQPHVCTVILLAKYLFYNLDLQRNGSRIFIGNSKCNKFMRIFNSVIDHNKEKFANLGLELVDLSSHSNRKGSDSMVYSGCAYPPSPQCK